MSTSAMFDRLEAFTKKVVKKKKEQTSSLVRKLSSGVNFPSLPLLSAAEESDKEELFLSKASMCCTLVDFSDPAVDVDAKASKEEALRELVEHMNKGHLNFTEPVCSAIAQLAASNLFRPLKPSEGGELDAEDEELTQEPAWPHMCLVYELLLALLEHREFQSSVAKKYINQRFVIRLLELFDSEDARERDVLKTILHRIYGKLLFLRGFIRLQVSYIFLRFAYETEHFNGTCELLEVLSSIVNGFALPLKIEHKQYLARVLMPLHKLKDYPIFHASLTYCVVQYLDKDPSLTLMVVTKLFRYWPKTCSQKEQLFLTELEEIIDVSKPDQFVEIKDLLFRQLAACIESSHFQVAERALYLWNNEYFLKLVSENDASIMPLVVPALNRVSTNHWNDNIVGLALNVLHTLMAMNHDLFNQCCSDSKVVGDQDR